jgi:hypothetical protein
VIEVIGMATTQTTTQTKAAAPRRKATSPARREAPAGRASTSSPTARSGGGKAPTARKRTSATAPATAPAAAARAAPSRPVLHGLIAAEQAVQHETVHIRLPLAGELRLPPREDLAFLGGVIVLTAIGVLEWPVAVLLGVGHELASNRHNKLLRSFGEALEEA